MIIGMDGGATKTAGVICDDEGQILGRHRGGRGTVYRTLAEESRRSLSETVSALCEQAGTSRAGIAFCALGMHGVDFDDEFDLQMGLVSKAIGVPRERIGLVNDGIAALWGATGAPAAAILQHGSGDVGAWRPRHGAEHAFSHLGVGGVFDMRVQLLRTVARMIDGRVEPTPLKDRTLAFFELTEPEYEAAICREQVPREKRKGTVRLIYEAWEAGDPAAAWLVESAIDDYALSLATMAQKTGSRSPDLVLGGGVIAQAPPRFWDLIRERLRTDWPDSRVTPPALPPELGAVVMAAFRTGRDPKACFDRLQAQCKEDRT